MRRIRTLVAAAAVVTAGWSLAAQAPPSFEAVSIKANTSGAPGGRMQTNPGRVIAENVAARQLVASAYGVRDVNLVIPTSLDWMNTDRFDIQATMPADSTPPQVNQMMQALLADRFKLVVRGETQNRPAFSLVAAKPDGSLGPSLKPASDPTCAAAQGTGPRCGSVIFSPGNLVGRSATWTQLINGLSGIPAVGRIVVDGGGTHAGTYDFDLKWAPVNGAGAASDGPGSIFTAVQEQLGLRLAAVDAPLPVIVVTDARRPEAN